MINTQNPIADPSSVSIENDPKLLEIKSRNIFLENSNLKLKETYQDVVEELEEKGEVIVNLETEVRRLTAELNEMHGNYAKDVEVRIQDEKEEKRRLQVKHEQASAEIKSLKSEQNALIKDLKTSSVALKSLEKEKKEDNRRFEKQVNLLESKISNLEDFKTNKVSEERELKVKMKKADKKLKSVLEREAKIKIKKSNNSVGTATENGVDDAQNNTISAPLKPTNMNQVNLTSLDPNSPIPTTSVNPSSMPTSLRLATLDSINMDQVSCTLDSTDKDQVSDTFDSSNMDQVFCTLDSTSMDQVSCTNIDPTSSDSDYQDENNLEKTELFNRLEAFCEHFGKKIDNFGDKFLNSS